MPNAIQRSALNQLFNEARTYNEWSEKPVDEQTVRELYDLLKWGPTSANCCPARFVWVRSPEGKAKLAALAAENNQPKILAAPLTVIIGHDLDFADKMPKLFPDSAAMLQKVFAQPGVAEVTAMRNGSLQGAYLIIAARALGLDCGPIPASIMPALITRFFWALERSQTSFAASDMASLARLTRATPG